MFNTVVGHWPFVFYVCDEMFFKSIAFQAFYLNIDKTVIIKAVFSTLHE